MASVLEIGLANAAMALVLAVLAALLCRLLRRPAFTHGLWLVVLLKLVTPPLVAIPLPWPELQPQKDDPAAAAFAVVMPQEPVAEPADEPALELPANDAEDLAQVAPTSVAEVKTAGVLGAWELPVVIAWLAGSVIVLAWIIRSVLRFQGLLRFAFPADASFQEIVVELAGKLKLARPPRAWLVPGIISPMLWALGSRPRLLFPAPLLNRLQPDQLRTIVLHELAHWRRLDHWVRFLELAVLVLYWWHPAVWWARTELHEAEEQCCDAWVIATLDGADRTYALALLETVAFISKARLPLPVAASGIGQVTHLRRRLTMIMSGQKRRSLTWAGCVALLALGLLLLPLAPIRAQPVKENAPPGNPNNVQVQGPGLFVQGAGQAGDKETIELLKRVLKLLEEKKGKAPGTGNAAEIAKARDEVKALTAAVAQKRQDLQVTENRLRQAQIRLAQLQGRLPPAGLTSPDTWRVVPRDVIKWEIKPDTKQPAQKGKTIYIQINQDGKIIQIPVTLPDPAKKTDRNSRPEELKLYLEGLPRNLERKIIKLPEPVKKPTTTDPFNNLPIAVPEPKKKGHLEDLRSRLDRLMREVEELRREIQRQPRDGTKK